MNVDILWIGYSALLIGVALTSWILSKYDKFENKVIRNTFIFVGAITGIISFLLVFIEQPRIENIFLNFLVGIPITTFGILGRIYAAFYLRSKGTTTALDHVSSIIKTGPYSWVRHPQYLTGIISLIGWFIIWGAIYCLLVLPLLIIIIILQAFIEEKYTLEKEFGNSYSEYKKHVGMFIPKIKFNF